MLNYTARHPYAYTEDNLLASLEGLYVNLPKHKKEQFFVKVDVAQSFYTYVRKWLLNCDDICLMRFNEIQFTRSKETTKEFLTRVTTQLDKFIDFLIENRIPFSLRLCVLDSRDIIATVNYSEELGLFYLEPKKELNPFYFGEDYIKALNEIYRLQNVFRFTANELEVIKRIELKEQLLD